MNVVADRIFQIGMKDSVRLEVESYSRRVKRHEWRRAYLKKWSLLVLAYLLAGPKWWRLIPDSVGGFFREL
jgi:hypothetical protein